MTHAERSTGVPPRADDIAHAMRIPALAYRLKRLLRRSYLVVDGFKLVGYRPSVPKHVSSLLARGDYEAPERWVLSRFLRPDDRVVEIGTCIGLVALIAARIVGAANVTTFEPNPDAAAVARENFSLNGYAIALREMAVGVQDGTLELSIGSDSWLGASALRDNHGRKPRVPMAGIAGVMDSLKPTVLLLDVEGMEISIVPATPLGSLRALMIEFHPDVIGEDGVEAIRQHLSRHGFASRTDLAVAATEVWERA